MANPATVEDIEARWRPLSEQETVNAEAFLADAWALLLSKRPTLDNDILLGAVDQANAIRVVSAMVIRVLRNPEGKVQEAIDDYSYRRSELVASGALHVTDDELAAITPTVTTARRRSVRLVTHGDD